MAQFRIFPFCTTAFLTVSIETRRKVNEKKKDSMRQTAKVIRHNGKRKGRWLGKHGGWTGYDINDEMAHRGEGGGTVR